MRSQSQSQIKEWFSQLRILTGKGSLHVDPIIAGLITEMGRSENSSDRKSTRLNSSHTVISYAVFCLKKKKKKQKKQKQNNKKSSSSIKEK